MSNKFKDSDFEDACRELQLPKINGWEFFTESHDVKIYRLYNEISGLYEYKIYGTLSDVSPEVCAQVYMDLEYRKKWDSYVCELEEVGAENEKLIYWNVNFPFPMSNRDYVYQREVRELDHNGQKTWVVLVQSQTSANIPEKSGVIRVDDYNTSMVLTSDGKVGSYAFMYYYDNPKGMIPTWLINWAAKSGVPGFLTMMQDACRGYPEYLTKKEQQTQEQNQS